MDTLEPRQAETEEKRTCGERKWTALSDGKTSLSHPIPIARALCHDRNRLSATCVWVVEYVAARRFPSRRITNLDRALVDVLSQHSEATLPTSRTEDVYATKASPSGTGSVRSCVTTWNMASAFRPLRGRSTACSSGLGATPLQRSCAQNTGQRASNIGSEFRNRSICWKQRSSSVLCDVRWTQECDLEEWVAARWQRDVPAATHSTTTANSCENCVCLRTPSWANPSDAPSRCRLVESWRAAPLVLPWAPSTTHLRDPESRVPGLGSGVAALPDSLDTQVSRLSFRVGLGRRLLFPVWAGRMSLALSGRGCADWYLWDEIGSRATARSEMRSDRQTSRAGTFALHRSCRIRTCNLQMRTWG